MKTARIEKLFHVLLWVIVAVGIVLRITVYLQNRDLIIDEANIARNLYERNLWQLTMPLSYEQYAPPVFLWIEKLCSILFGFSEYSLKLYPLITGMVSLFIMRIVLLRLMPAHAAWLPLLIFAAVYFYIKYSTELKQYMPDVMVTLLLLLSALKIDMQRLGQRKFITSWVCIGTLAIWSSMPAVFMLAGVGCYYMFIAVQHKNVKHYFVLFIIGASWLINFSLYYLLILKEQANSAYLQQYHSNYFLIATPVNAQTWHHNWTRLREIFFNLGGHQYYAYLATLLFLLVGGLSLALKRRAWSLLIILPVLLTFAAAALRQFSLIDRVILFMMPLLLIIMGYGFAQFIKHRSWVLRVPAFAMAVFIVVCYNEYQFFYTKLPAPEMKESLKYLSGFRPEPSKIYVHNATISTYIYYTQIHPLKEKYGHLQKAHLLQWPVDYRGIVAKHRDTTYFLYAGGADKADESAMRAVLPRGLQLIDSFSASVAFVGVYTAR